jgi:hypothetical protein
MAVKSVFAEKRDLYDLIPVIQNWLIENGYDVSAIANRIDAKNGESNITLFFGKLSIGLFDKSTFERPVFRGLKRISFKATSPQLSDFLPLLW